MTTQPVKVALDRTNVSVVISNEPAMPCGNAIIDASIRVEVHATGDLLFAADRSFVAAWGLRPTPAGRKLAARLKACIEAGRAFDLAEVKLDVNGNRYVSATSLIWGRRMNSDLKAKGF